MSQAKKVNWKLSTDQLPEVTWGWESFNQIINQTVLTDSLGHVVVTPEEPHLSN